MFYNEEFSSKDFLNDYVELQEVPYNKKSYSKEPSQNKNLNQVAREADRDKTMQVVSYGKSNDNAKFSFGTKRVKTFADVLKKQGENKTPKGQKYVLLKRSNVTRPRVTHEPECDDKNVVTVIHTVVLRSEGEGEEQYTWAKESDEGEMDDDHVYEEEMDEAEKDTDEYYAVPERRMRLTYEDKTFHDLLRQSKEMRHWQEDKASDETFRDRRRQKGPKRLTYDLLWDDSSQELSTTHYRAILLSYRRCRPVNSRLM